MIPSIQIFTRHSAGCPYEGDESCKKCKCRRHLRWSYQGTQYRRAAKSRSWAGAEKMRRQIELQYEAAEANKPIEQNQAVTIERAITSFMDGLEGGKASKATRNKYALTLQRLQSFCDAHGLMFVREVTREHLLKWRLEWDKYYGSNFSLRNQQSRVRHFFRHCTDDGWITNNPAAGKKLSPIKIVDSDFVVDPVSEEEYQRLLAAIPICDGVTPANQIRVKAMMALQRWCGLSLIDAACLPKAALVKIGEHYRVDTFRKKSGVRITNVIPTWLAEELLALQNSNKNYFFVTGESEPTHSVTFYDKLYRRIFRAAGVTGGSHRLRHRFAVGLLEHGIDIRVVSKALGHRNLATTERYYSKWSAKQQLVLEEALAKGWD